MDIQMPNLDGPGATRIIRNREQELCLQRTPIIAVTANVMPYQANGYRAAGMDGIVAKPIQMTELFSVLEAVLETSEASMAKAVGS